ncbi:MAG: hypothetical protein K0S70_111 [Microbacterium sp.]|jgi:hypothetical protein|nr:hypothetical protein [Microbacterium sp.]
MRLRFPLPNLDRLSRPWTRYVEQRLEEQAARNEREDAEALNVNKGQNAAAQRMAKTIRSMPFVVVGQGSSTGFGLVAGWNVVATVDIRHPDEWQDLSIVAMGGAAAVDTLSGGLTICEARIVIAGIASPIFAPAKDAAASQVNNILSPNFGLPGVGAFSGGVTSCTLELRPLNSNAFPARSGNYASLTVIATFTNPV